MNLKPDLTVREINIPPIGHWCDSGHVAPELFKRNGPDGDLEPTKFFKITSDGSSQIICEPCLIVANHLAKLKKEGKM